MGLSNRKAATRQEASPGGREEKRQGGGVAGKQDAAGGGARRPSRRNALQHIRSRGDIPKHNIVLSAPGEEMELPDSLARDFAILRENAERAVILIAEERLAEHTGVDHQAMTLIQRCRERGWRMRRLAASRSMLEIIYDNAARQASERAVMRQASELEQKFDSLISEALGYGASDVHLEVRRMTAEVRFRRNGRLLPGERTSEWPVDQARSLATVIYQVIADEKDTVFKERETQDANIERVIDGERLNIRLATIPAYPSGFDMVMRLLPLGQSSDEMTLQALGYSAAQIERIEDALLKPVGALVMAGTTGSGKSTSLVAMLRTVIEEAGYDNKVITVEDPPEYSIRGATQVPVIRGRTGKDSAERDFAAAIRAAMRCDPDVLMIGEVRDTLSSRLLKDAVQSGHQAFTTIHAQSPFGIISRLRSQGLGGDVLGSADFFTALIHQSLVPLCCPQCAHGIDHLDTRRRRERELLDRLKRAAATSEDDLSGVRIRNREGCEACTNGIVGRTVVASVVIPDAQMLRYFADGHDLEAELHYLRNGGETIVDHGLEKVLSGQCDPLDTEKKIGFLELPDRTL